MRVTKKIKEKYRYSIILLKELVKTDFKVRYQESALGYLWAVLRPLFLFAILYVVFVWFLKFGSDIPHYPVYLLTGTVLWNFFTESTSMGMNAIISRSDIMRKINFPKYIVVVSGTVTSLINLLINVVVIIVFAIFNGVAFHWTALLLIPIIIELYVFSLGLGFLLGALNVKFRDVSHIWDIITQGLFYATPIIYPITMILNNFGTAGRILMMNPMAQIIQDARWSLITQESVTVWSLINTPILRLIPLALVVIIFIVSAIYFRKKSKSFAEEI
jgi:ABC-2 type transport system permease protein